MNTTSLPGNLPVGHRIRNRYRIDGYLGGGTFGHVYEVWDERQEQQVALKLLGNTPLGPWAEAQVLTQLRGDYILPVLNADDEAGVAFVVTEVMRDGCTGDHNTSDVGVDIDRAARWVHQAAIGVARGLRLS